MSNIHKNLYCIMLILVLQRIDLLLQLMLSCHSFRSTEKSDDENFQFLLFYHPARSPEK